MPWELMLFVIRTFKVKLQFCFFIYFVTIFECKIIFLLLKQYNIIIFLGNIQGKEPLAYAHKNFCVFPFVLLQKMIFSPFSLVASVTRILGCLLLSVT